MRVTHYNSMSRVIGFETKPFNNWHKSEIQNGFTCDSGIGNNPASLSRAEALELINRWNSATGNHGFVYTIGAN